MRRADPRREVGALAELVRGARSVVALTGAGISVASGIADFRSPGTGIWEHVNPMEVAHIRAWRADPARFWSFYGARFEALRDKQPNAGHEALAELERRGVLDAVITQNIDMLHRKAQTRTLIEVHGSIASSACESCGAVYDFDAVIARLGGPFAACDCGEPLKPGVVLFGEVLPVDVLERAAQLAAGADLLLCVGSSLEVHPVAALPGLTLDGGGSLAIVTRSVTPWDDYAAVKLEGDIADELQALVEALS
ncbi:MAG: NAD-dependent deacylase [Solirubrobacterales bacterium]|nr:NAD-dependent deacylase [Solirubrobacterales bacterium]